MLDDDAIIDALVAAVWRRVGSDLGAGRPCARAWLDGADFRTWCGLSLPDADPEHVRRALLARWRSRRRHAA